MNSMGTLVLCIVAVLLNSCLHIVPQGINRCGRGGEAFCRAERQLTFLLNRYRRQRGLNTVVHHPGVVAIARTRSEQQLNLSDITHEGFPQQRYAIARSLGINIGVIKAENIAMFELNGSESLDTIVAQFMELWINSPQHQKNITGHYSYYGASLAQKGNCWVATAFFL